VRRFVILGATAVGAAAVAYAWLAPGSVRRDPGLSVLLISIDTLRADALGAYGRKDVETPRIDRLAAEGARFDQAHAHNVVTLPSHANLLSGRHPYDHGVRDNSGFRFPPATATLATILKERGYRTGAFVSAFPLDSRFGLDSGFEVYDDRLGGSETFTAFVEPERPGTETVAAAARWLEAQQGKKTFCFVHLYEPHFPYRPPEPFASRFRDRPYHGEVSAVDAALAPLLDPLLAAGRDRRTLVVFTSDHGESLGEHGEATHGIFAYQATLRVPLIVYAAGVVPRAVVTDPVRHVDVLPTVLDALAQDVPEDLPGRSLLPLLAGRGGAAPATYFEALSTSLNQGWAPLHGVLRGGLKYVDLPLPELYDVAADPGETRNLVAHRPHDLDALRGLLARFRAGDGPVRRAQESAETLERLNALGYVTGGAHHEKATYTEDDDPKRLIDVDRENREVISRYNAGDIAGALALCRENVRKRPKASLAWLHLAYLERAGGDLAAAVQAARQAFELAPLDAEVVSLYANYLTESGRPKEAADLLAPYMTGVTPDIDVLTARGMALATSGRRDEALATFERARKVDPSNAMVAVNIGAVHLRSGDRTRAREAFDAALALDPGVARAENGLGVIAAAEGRWDEAIERWRRAVALNPKDYQTLFNLGQALRRQGREAEARPYFEAYLKHAPPALEARDMARVRGWLGAARAPSAGGR
jgi:arylsulfatase A-like enzyme/Tfp pilus assembly protein PilF